MFDIGKRIKECRLKLNMSAEKLAELVGMSPATIYRYENGDIKKVSTHKLEPIAKALRVQEAYLMGWEDERVTPLPANNLRNVTKHPVPVLGSIAAGTPILAEESYGMYVDADSDIHCDYALRVDGDSMEPTIRKGDIVFIRAQDDVNDGEIAAVLLDDSATLKRVYHIKDGLQLLSDNASMYPPMICTIPDTTTIRILGKAVSFTRKI